MDTHVDVTCGEDERNPVPNPDPSHVAIWIALNRARQSIVHDVDKALRANGLPQLKWYDVLWAIEKRGGAARPSEVMNDLLFEHSALSHMVKRIESAGLIQISPAENDGRGRVLRMTSKGLQMRAAIWEIYGKALETKLGALGQLADPEAVANALNAVSEA